MAAGNRVFCLLPPPQITKEERGCLGNSFVSTFYGLCLIAIDMLLLTSHTVHSSFHCDEISTQLEESTFFFIATGHVKLALAIIARLAWGPYARNIAIPDAFIVPKICGP